jgi:hypothetical protein
VVAATRRIRARDQRLEESLPWVTSHSMASAGPMFPITHGQALARDPRRPGPSTPQSGPRRRADRLGTILHAIHEHTGEAR